MMQLFDHEIQEFNMIRPEWFKEKGKYVVRAFGVDHEFDELENSDGDLLSTQVEDKKAVSFKENWINRALQWSLGDVAAAFM